MRIVESGWMRIIQSSLIQFRYRHRPSLITVPSRDNVCFERASITFAHKVKAKHICTQSQTRSNTIAYTFERKAKHSRYRVQRQMQSVV